jgi:transposase
LRLSAFHQTTSNNHLKRTGYDFECLQARGLMKKITEAYIGVDISKKQLDIYVYPTGTFYKIDNSEEAIEKCIAKFSQYSIKQIACEATGGYEKLLASTLKKHGYSLWIIDPRRIKGFIVATGCKGKTDKIDAQKIAEFAAKNTPDYPVVGKTENQEQLQALTNRKNDLQKFLVAEKTRLKHPSHALCKASIETMVKVLEAEIKAIDRHIGDIIRQDTELYKKAQILESIPGIGQASAAMLLSFVPELGTLSGKKVSALIGVCPYDNSSGSYKGKKTIRGGRVVPRNMLYMCALTTIKYHLPLKELYDRLIANKKPFKVAIVAIMHKLIIIANALLKKGQMCQTFS